MNALDRYRELKSRFERADREYQRVQGQEEQLLSQLKSLGFSSEVEAREWMKEAAEKERALQARCDKLSRTADDLLSSVEERLR